MSESHGLPKNDREVRTLKHLSDCSDSPSHLYSNARADVWPDVQRRLELCAVAGFTADQVEVERVAVEISLEVDFGRETATRAAERLAVLPPFAPAAETWARAVVLSKNWTRCAVWLH